MIRVVNQFPPTVRFHRPLIVHCQVRLEWVVTIWFKVYALAIALWVFWVFLKALYRDQ